MDYKLVTTSEELDALCSELTTAEIIAVDTETEGIEYSDIIVGIALSHKPGFGRYIPIRHEAIDGVRYQNQLTPEEVYAKLGPILEEKPCTGHNTKFDLKMFWKDGININYVHDTLIMAHVLGAEANNSRGLKQLVEKFFNHKMNDIDSLFPKVGNKKPKIQPKILSPEDIEFYGCEDGNWSYQLFALLSRMFKDRGRLTEVYRLEMRLLPIVAEMESFGVPVSMDFLVENGNKASEYIHRLQDEILHEIRQELKDPDYEINLKSQPQLSQLLFDHLGLPIIKLSMRTNKPSTDAAVLQELAKISPVVQRILTLRALEKLNNTYLTGLQASVDSDGRIRGNFNQVGTASGRFSSSSPNLQNLPKDQTFILWEPKEVDRPDIINCFSNCEPKLLDIRDEAYVAYNTEVGTWGDGYLGEASGKSYSVYNGKLYESWKCKTRDFISAPNDHYLIEVDYSQVELRIMAGESQEPTLLDAYNEGRDVHTATAAIIEGIPIEYVTKEQRHVGKTINFSLLYGAGPYNIAQQLGIEVEEAEDIVNRYFTNLSSVQSWINRVKQDTKMDGYAETVFGRRRNFPNVRGSDRKLAEKELRESVNHHIQGAAADIMKTALIRSNILLKKYFGDKIKIVSTVHDSMLVECESSCSPDEVLRVLKLAMEDISLEPEQIEAQKRGEDISLTVVNGWPRLEVDAKIGKSWGSSGDFTQVAEHLPSIADQSTLPKIRVRKIAQERESYEQELVTWNINVLHPLGEEVNWLLDFFDGRKDNKGAHVNLTFSLKDGTVYNKQLSGKYKISFDDEIDFRLKLGPCTFAQDMESLDYSEVLKGIDFGIA